MTGACPVAREVYHMYVNKRPVSYRVRHRWWRFQAWFRKSRVQWTLAVLVVAAGFALVVTGVR